MKKRTLSFLLLLCVLVIIPTEVFALDGHKLVSFMRELDKAERGDTSTNLMSAGIFSGYVSGIFDSNSNQICLPAEGSISYEQLTAVVKKYLRENPAEWSNRADAIVIKALKRAFPCGRQ